MTKEQAAAVVDGLAKTLAAIDGLMAESAGVAGLHLNGDVAPWDELVSGGRYEAWLEGLDVGRAALAEAQAAEAESTRPSESEAVEAAKRIVLWTETCGEGPPEAWPTTCGDSVTVARALLALSSRPDTGRDEVIEALHRLAIASHVRMTYGGGTVPSGGHCRLCKAEWSLFDGNKPIDGKEYHKPDCLLSRAMDKR